MPSTVQREVRPIEQRLIDEGATLVDEFEGIRLYARSPTYEKWFKQLDRGTIALVYDVPRTGISTSVAREIASITAGYKFCLRMFKDELGHLMGLYPSVKNPTNGSFTGFDPEKEDKLAKVPTGEPVVFEMHGSGPLEKSTIMGLKELLMKARENRE